MIRTIVAAMCAVLVVLVFGVHRVGSGATAAGDVVTITYLLTVVAFPIRSIGWLLGDFPRSVVGFRRVRSVLRATGGLPVRPVVRRALAMGDDLHSRHTASGALLRLHLLDALVREPDLVPPDARRALAEYLEEAEYLFLHVAMAASKAAADAASGVPGSGVVTAMALSCDEFALRVSGLGREWFRAPLPPPADLRGRLFDDWTTDDLDYVGGESLITETTGLGGLAAAASFPLQDFSAGTPEAMVELTGTSANTVGSMYQPLSSARGRPPPTVMRAPSARPFSM